MSNSVWDLINTLVRKKGITEIAINGPKNIFVERDGSFIRLNASVLKKDIYQFAKEVAEYNQRPFSPQNPMLDGNLPDGSRVNIISEPYCHGGPSVSIRRYLKNDYNFDTDHAIFGLNKKWIEFLKAVISSRLNLIISGGTGVGKTTFLNLILNEISPDERLIIIEDTIELKTSLPNVVRLESRVSHDTYISSGELLKNALRMRPDRIILGEVRGREVLELLQAMNTGHDGSVTSIHANSAPECIGRLETLLLMSGVDLPISFIRRQIASSVDLIIQLNRSRQGERIVDSILEITGMEGDNIISQQILSRGDSSLDFVGVIPNVMDRLHRDGNLPLEFFSQL